MRDFHLHVPDADLADLRARLARTRLPDQAPGAPWAYGTDRAYLADLLAHWRDGFDWRDEEARLNALPQIQTEIGGIGLHALHVPGQGPAPLPLLLLHGWPGSVFEFLDIIPMLTDPARFGADSADAFTIVAPSLPGYGLSFAPGQPRLGIAAMADCCAELMTRLGYPRFGAQGGDWGAAVATRLGLDHAARIIGLHFNYLIAVRRDPALFDDPDPEVQRFRAELTAFQREETGYQVIQGTKPQTLAFALTDSPAGLAAWFVEKFRSWTDCDGNPETALTRAQMLADIALYWFTGCIGASFWPYYERLHSPWMVPEGRRVEVPVGYAEFPREILHPPRRIAEQVFPDIRRWQRMPRGGHFAAMEQTAALAAEIRAFFRDLSG